ncbi:HAMP domain-containing histidine kinase (plasmid) [Massilia forsythiae]|uniref:histidine kinase n=1 Tax=Massilia forsythiae TaxID=2728020 RepID=A0A7Z2W2Q1_9BURK|nr:HAMP domain-containing sensor histidine kinase [Massilia forsythiae]QJE03678.1 HAMP domain-containing histidine kinase [Massilia forsythiae]
MNLATDQNCDDDGLSNTARKFLALRDATMERWEREIRSRVDGAQALHSPILTNTLPAFLDNIAEALSPLHARENGTSHTNAAAVHGGERARMTDFGPDEVIHEYQILRESIAAEMAGKVDLTSADWAIIDRSINLAVREAVREFVATQDDLRRKLAAALSHDMRTPLAVVLNGAEMIKITGDWSMAKRTASKIASNAQRLQDMMTELLDALTSKGGDQLPLTISTFDIAALAGEVSNEFQQSSGVDIETSLESVQGFWCRDSMRRALENLVNNAVKYGDGAEVGIMAAQTRGRLMLSVHNTGVPIPKERQSAIFDYLAREPANPSVIGWGLGLPFVKRVAESHGGSVAVDSSPETGTTFLIDIPVDCRPYVESSGFPRVAAA